MSPEDHLRMLAYYPPELVEVVYQPAACADLIREIARMRCEADEALEALESWMAFWLPRMRYTRSVSLQQIEEGQEQLAHIAQHLRWVQDPKA